MALPEVWSHKFNITATSGGWLVESDVTPQVLIKKKGELAKFEKHNSIEDGGSQASIVANDATLPKIHQGH